MDFDTARRLVFDSYVTGLPRARAATESRTALDEFLGDVDRQAGSWDMAERMALAGRVFAASVALAGGSPPELDEVEALIDARLGYGRSQREQAAPLDDGRLWPEDEAASGLGELIAEADDDELAEECATVASYLLQFGLRPPMDVDAALTVGEDLREIALEGQAVLDIAGAFGLAGIGPGGLLSHAAESTRAVERGLAKRAGSGGGGPRGSLPSIRESWIHIGSSLVAARGAWLGSEPDWEAVVARATERIASSLVLEDPHHFAAQACADHAMRVAIDAATVWLDEALAHEESHEDSREFIWEGMLEAASSGLVGAWVESQLAQQG
jgi:hypothetical protein